MAEKLLHGQTLEDLYQNLQTELDKQAKIYESDLPAKQNPDQSLKIFIEAIAPLVIEALDKIVMSNDTIWSKIQKTFAEILKTDQSNPKFAEKFHLLLLEITRLKETNLSTQPNDSGQDFRELLETNKKIGSKTDRILWYGPFTPDEVKKTGTAEEIYGEITENDKTENIKK